MRKNWNWFKGEQGNASHSRNLPAQPSGTSGSMPVSSSYFRPLSQFYEDMDRMFDHALRGFTLPALFGGSTGMQSMFTPNVDIASTEKEYTVTVEIPGIEEKDVRIELTREGQLIVSGEKRMENDNQGADFHRIERAYGSFQRILSLPEDAIQENIEAQFNSGVLTISVPRQPASESQNRRIEVNAGGNTRRSRQEKQNDNQHAHSHPKRAA